MSIDIRPATTTDIEGVLTIINRYAEENLMLPRTAAQIQRVLSRFLVAEADGQIVGCGSLVELTPRLVELRSLAVVPELRGTGLGRQLVEALVAQAREIGYEQLCALTLNEGFFNRLGFPTVDRWDLSPKIWHECIYCPKLAACDEIPVLMNLTEGEIALDTRTGQDDRVRRIADCGLRIADCHLPFARQ
ncbi:MAG: GNAT family N-acetyltransferase [Chloroflexi bacterium HGW-Chloroflexi-1]|nr:MAG: GNAT family N-acetyltransferase [Chloroflexi bacterium HGW-Chloroflexi-1]